MTTINTTTTGRSILHKRPTARSTSSSVVTKRSKATDRLDQTPGISTTSTLKTTTSAVV
jgi:hypothetical protein